MAPSTDQRVALRDATDADQDFLYAVYASTRQDELAATGWPAETVDAFLRDQFRLQDTYYRRNYPEARFQVIWAEAAPVGRLYTQILDDGIRLMDIALLPAFRGKGLGGRLLRDLMAKADALRLPLSLHVECNNPIRAYYQRLGFLESPVDGLYLRMERRVPEMAA